MNNIEAYTGDEVGKFIVHMKEKVIDLPTTKTCKCDDKKWTQFYTDPKNLKHQVVCINCEAKWNTKAKYVHKLPDFEEVAAQLIPPKPKQEEKPMEWPKGWSRKTRRNFKAALKKAKKKGIKQDSPAFYAILKQYGFNPKEKKK